MQAACLNMGWKIRGQWCVIPPESFGTGNKEVSYLQLLLDSNFLSSYFWEKRQGYLAIFFLTNIFSWGNLILLKSQDVSIGNFTPFRCFIAKASRAASSLMSGDPSLSPSPFLYPSTSYPPFFHCSSFSESNRHSQHPTPTAFLCPRSGCELVSSSGHSPMLKPIEEEQSCRPRCQDSTST